MKLRFFFPKLSPIDSLPSNIDILFVSSCGGHFVQLYEISKEFSGRKVFFIVNDDFSPPSSVKGNFAQITHAERNLLQVFNLIEAIWYVLILRPRVILSTGAAPAVPFGLVGRLIGSYVIFVESLSKISTPSMTAILMQYIANKLYVQWPSLVSKLRSSIFAGNLLP